MRQRRASPICLAIVACLALAPLTAAQTPPAAHTITGTVTEATSRLPLQTVSIELIDSTGQGLTLTLTDANGRYRLSPPDDGPFRVRASRIGYLRLESPFVRTDTGAVTVDFRMARGAFLDSVLIVDVAPAISRTQQLIRGRLQDDDTGTSLENGSLELLDARGNTVATATIGRNGAFRIVTPGPGTFALRGRHIGYQPSVQHDLQMRLGDTLRVDFRLSRTVTLLAPVLITESSQAWAGRNTTGRREMLFTRFQRFANLRHAQFFFRDTIDAWDKRGETLGRLLDRRVIPSVPRGPQCSGGIMYFDGFLLPGPAEELLELSAIDLVEVYTHPSLPAEFMAPVFKQPGQRSAMVPPCRVVSIWPRPKMKRK